MSFNVSSLHLDLKRWDLMIFNKEIRISSDREDHKAKIAHELKLTLSLKKGGYKRNFKEHKTER